MRFDVFDLTRKSIVRELMRDFPDATSDECYDFADSLVNRSVESWRRRPWTRPPWQRGRRKSGPQPYKSRGWLWHQHKGGGK